MLNRIQRLALLTVLLVTTAAGLAQTRPALVKNVDEPGRTPYSSEVNSVICDKFGCFFAFKPVPAGFRLVILYASGIFTAIRGTPSGSELNASNFGAVQQYLPPPFPTANGFYSISAPVTYFVEPGQTPSLDIFSAVSGSVADASITGYLVAVN